jgi:hypothetical protein
MWQKSLVPSPVAKRVRSGSQAMSPAAATTGSAPRACQSIARGSAAREAIWRSRRPVVRSV